MCDTIPNTSFITNKHTNTYSEPDNGGAKTFQQPIQDLSTFEGRLSTYINWPNKTINPIKLAEAGFYSINYGDIVKCAFCSVEGFRWLKDDNPMDDHISWDQEQGRNCPFIRERRSQQNQDTVPNPTNGDTCGKYGIEILPNSVPEDNNVTKREKLGVIKARAPANSEYIIFDKRLASFAQWPKSMKQKPAALAQAGFYYLGVGDQTLCFHCGGGLKDWEENDDPWEQHALWFSKCNFLILKKGLDFIQKVKISKDPAKISQPSTSANCNSETKAELSIAKSDSKSKPVESTLCKICFKNELGVVFLPCGHIVACVDCATALNSCAVCRKPLEETLRAFLS